jgi:Sec-independent protein translocase protein TatA
MLPNSEWILLAVLAVILLKPEDIPVIARFIAKFVRQAQQMWNYMVPEFDKTAINTELQKTHPFHSAPPQAKIAPLKD